MSSFDYELKDHLRRAGAPVAADYASDVETLIDDAKALVRRSMRPLIYAAASYGFGVGILATLAVQHIFGGT